MSSDTMVLLISGGIDSPVAGYLLARQGVKLVALSGLVNPADAAPHIEKIGKLLNNLSKAVGQEIDFYVFEQRIALSVFSNCARPGLTCVLCKRMMSRIAERLCRKVGGSAIIMGDSLGQVASQTLQNMNVVEQAVAVPIIRPLVGLDKVEIVRIAKEMGSFELSNIKSPGCAFVPDKPATRARLGEVLGMEKKLSIDALVETIAATLRKIEGVAR